MYFSHIPPSQGGKYSGFGYTKDPPPRSQSQEFVDTAISSLASVSSLLFSENKSMGLFKKQIFFTGLVISVVVSDKTSKQGVRKRRQIWRTCQPEGS